MNIMLYQFAKDKNSTKQPANGSVLSAEVYEPCSIISPSFILSGPGIDNVFRNNNYVYVPAWQRYYWITDKQFVDGRFLISCQVDVLASFKVGIGASSQYVLRSASSSNAEITDMAYPMTGEIIDTIALPYQGLDPFQSALADGIFVIGIVGEADTTGSARYGAVNYYEFNSSEFNNFLTALMSNQNDWLNMNTADLSDSTAKMILNPMQYITTCMWFPLARTGTPSSRTIKFGWWKITGITCATPGISGGIPARGFTMGFRIMQGQHPQATARGNYLNRAPYSEYHLYIPPVGAIPIDSDIVAQIKYLAAEIQVDYPTGQAVMHLRGTANDDGTGTVTEIGYTTLKIGVDVPIAQIAVDTISTAKGGLNTISGAVNGFSSGGILGAIFGAVNSAIDTTIHATEPLPNIMASAGSLAAYQFHSRFYGRHKLVTPDAPALIGKPLCDYVQLNTLSGYIQCATAHFENSIATSTEVDEVESYMRSGFFYE